MVRARLRSINARDSFKARLSVFRSPEFNPRGMTFLHQQPHMDSRRAGGRRAVRMAHRQGQRCSRFLCRVCDPDFLGLADHIRAGIAALEQQAGSLSDDDFLLASLHAGGLIFQVERSRE